MESKAKIFGHAIHPILIVYPLGLLSTAVIFDIIYLATGNPTWTTVSFWMIAAGIIGGLLAAVFGLIDYLAIPSGTRASRIGLLHGLTNVFVVILFIASWLLRRNYPDVPCTAALIHLCCVRTFLVHSKSILTATRHGSGSCLSRCGTFAACRRTCRRFRDSIRWTN